MKISNLEKIYILLIKILIQSIINSHDYFEKEIDYLKLKEKINNIDNYYKDKEKSIKKSSKDCDKSKNFVQFL